MKYPNIPIANHGKEALEIIEKNGLPDMILMDIQMYERMNRKEMKEEMKE